LFLPIGVSAFVEDKVFRPATTVFVFGQQNSGDDYSREDFFLDGRFDLRTDAEDVIARIVDNTGARFIEEKQAIDERGRGNFFEK